MGLFEDRTFEEILERLLEGARGAFPELDTREGSLIYSALAPAAMELNNLYLALDVVLEMSYADTASRDFLIRRSLERGISPHGATYAVIEAEVNPEDVQIPLGTRFRGGAVVYASSGVSGGGYLLLTAETAGRVGNISGGQLQPVRFVEGLQTIRVRALVVPGQDEEGTESLRQRYMDSHRAQAFGGNIAAYREAVLAISGVGGVRVFPVPRGPGTVGIGIIAADFSPPSETLIAAVQEILDPPEGAGQGVGLAPIGHHVTVRGVSLFPLAVSSRLSLAPGVEKEGVRARAEAAVEAYFLELRSAWDSGEPLMVRLSQVDTRLLDVQGVLDVADTTLNGQRGNLLLEEMCVPGLSGFTLV